MTKSNNPEDHICNTDLRTLNVASTSYVHVFCTAYKQDRYIQISQSQPA